MSTIDQQFVEYIVKALVGNPDKVKVERTIDEKGVLLELTVSQEDLGRVIGKRGLTAQSIRTLLRALGTKNDARYNLKIVDNNVENDSSTKGSGSGWSSSPTSSESNDETNPNEESVEEVDEEEPEEESRLSRTRKELEDLDDLDI